MPLPRPLPTHLHCMKAEEELRSIEMKQYRIYIYIRMHVSRDELEKKYILKKFFNFSEAFIIHAKISHSHTHTHPHTVASSLPHTHL